MRGTLGQQPELAGLDRSIPAHAGNTHSAVLPALVLPVHPRACGEHKQGKEPSVAPSGPSPRMRGTRASLVRRLVVHRSIPAHAGNTCMTCTVASSSTVHPRACGEHLTILRTTSTVSGPSPRMRGTQRPLQSPLDSIRSIPAHAGNTYPLHINDSSASVHPRACGEHDGVRLRYAATSGPSPRMRGTLAVLAVQMVWARSIPAHAGNTICNIPSSNFFTVHPRACGEHSIIPTAKTDSAGPSPRMRGTRAGA